MRYRIPLVAAVLFVLACFVSSWVLGWIGVVLFVCWIGRRLVLKQISTKQLKSHVEGIGRALCAGDAPDKLALPTLAAENSPLGFLA